MSFYFPLEKNDAVSDDIASFDITRNVILHSYLFHVLLEKELFLYSNVTERSHPTFDEFRDQPTLFGTSFVDYTQLKADIHTKNPFKYIQSNSMTSVFVDILPYAIGLVVFNSL